METAMTRTLPHRLIYPFLIVLLSASVAACNRGAGYKMAPALEEPAKAGQMLALEHWVAIQTEEDRIPEVFRAAHQACAKAAAEQCVVLESSMQSGREAFGRIKLRARPPGIAAIKAALSREGKLVKQTTTATDLAQPIHDGAKKLAMLTSYRAKLETLLQRGDLKADDLIKLNRALAEVQSEIETASGTQAHLERRVNTEILNIDIAADLEPTYGGPIKKAARDFGTDLAQGMGAAITALAYAIPFSVLLALLVWAFRAWRRRGRRSAAARS
jgi:hypothetical protein